MQSQQNGLWCWWWFHLSIRRFLLSVLLRLGWGPRVHVARTCAETCGEIQRGENGRDQGFDAEAFASDFLAPSGSSSVIVPATATGFDAFNVVSYNTYLDSYLMVSATEEGDWSSQ